jgi:hypothetical protein
LTGVILDEVESIEFWCQNREKPLPFPEPPGLRLDDPRVVEGLIRALTKRTGISVRAAPDAHVAEFQDKDHVSQDHRAGPTQLLVA